MSRLSESVRRLGDRIHVPAISRSGAQTWRVGVGVILALLVVPRDAAARTWYVLPDSTGDAPFIQAAVDSALDGDTILIAPGRHLADESGYIHVRGKSLSLMGELGWGQTRVPAFAVREAASVVLQGLDFGWGFQVIDVGDVVIRECHAGPSTNTSSANMDHDKPMRVEIVDCVFEEIHTSPFPGTEGGALTLIAGRSYSAVVRGCVFRNNSTTNRGGGINVRQAGLGDQVEIVNNLFLRNSAPQAGAIHVRGVEAPVLIVRNTFVGNTSGDGAVYIDGNANVTNNIFAWNNCFGLWDNGEENICSCNLYWSNWQDGNQQQWSGFCVAFVQAIVNPLFCGRRVDDFRLAQSSPALPANYPPELQSEGCDGIIGAFGIGCSEVPVLDSSWGSIKHKFTRER